MSQETYSAGVKELLCRKTAFEVGLDSEKPDATSRRCDKCCALAFFYGVTLFSRRLRRDTMTLAIENERLLEICTYIMIHHFLATPDVRHTYRGGRTRFEVTFGRDLVGRELTDIFDSDYRDLSFACECENCVKMFVRGVFLSAGNVTDPGYDYRVEFLLKDLKTAESLSDFIGEYFSPKIVKRRSDHVVYVKGGERVEEFFALIGAEKVALDIMTTSIEKETMNALNRSCNCEAANMRKTVNASVAGCHAIQKLRDSGKFDYLPDELKEIACLRESYPEASLTELSAKTEGRISRSGINRKMKKLIELSEE